LSENTTIQEFHAFSGHPAKFWPSFLAFASRQADAQLCVLLNKTSSCWKELCQWSSDQRRRTLPEPLSALLTELAEKCLKNGRGSAHIDISTRTFALGLRFDQTAEEQARVAIFFIKSTHLAKIDEILGRLQLIADTPAIYQRERAARQSQKDLACFTDVLDMLLLLNAETRFLAGYPGEYCCMARRNGQTWYVAGISARESGPVSVDLSSILDGTRSVKVYSDQPGEAGKLKVSELEVSGDKPMVLELKKNGGFVFKVPVEF